MEKRQKVVILMHRTGRNSSSDKVRQCFSCEEQLWPKQTSFLSLAYKTSCYMSLEELFLEFESIFVFRPVLIMALMDKKNTLDLFDCPIC
jgi:hypothetical protein